jgi:hypothetical protein
VGFSCNKVDFTDHPDAFVMQVTDILTSSNTGNLQQQHVSSGDILTGLHIAVEDLSWSSQNRVLLHIPAPAAAASSQLDTLSSRSLNALLLQLRTVWKVRHLLSLSFTLTICNPQHGVT